MLKYEALIERMTEEEKIGALCDVRRLSEESYRIKGIPSLRAESAERLGAGEFPTSEALANTWDLGLIREVADVLSARAAEANADILTVPAPRAKLSPYGRALSEDPFLASSISREYFRAAARAQITASADGFGIEDGETGFLDTEPNERLLHEFLCEPYARALGNTGRAVIRTVYASRDGAYGGVSGFLSRVLRENADFKGTMPVCGALPPEEQVAALTNGELFFEGSPLALENALSRYRRLLREVQAGEAEESALSAEVEAGRALAPEALDAAVDRLLELVFSVKRKHSQSGKADGSLARRAAYESLVLLKNKNGFLPLRRRLRICLIGDIAFDGDGARESRIDECERLLELRGYRSIGKARGYELERTRSEDMTDDAVALAKEADAVILFLGMGEKRERKAEAARKIALPANQMALLDSLGAYREKIVAVLPSDAPWDMGIPRNCAAVIAMPSGLPAGNSVLADTLMGEWNPCGRLASTVCFRTDETYERRRTERLRDGIKTGILLGYRRYGSEDGMKGFPFGYGLSYTRFSYSALTVNEDGVTVTVKNEGRMRGTETVQLYAGKSDSAVLRPEKVLIGFARITLKPGEEGTVRIPTELPTVFSSYHGKCVVEGGRYELFVGASVCDIRLTAALEAQGDVLVPDGEKLSDYIHTKSNILSDHYQLEAKIKRMKRSVFNWVASGALFAMAIILKLYCASADTEPRFFLWFEAVLCLLGLGLAVVEMIQRSNTEKAEKEMQEQETAILFSEADQLVRYNATAMFEEEFDTEEEPSAFNDTGEDAFMLPETEYFPEGDTEQSFANAVREFELFAKQRGCLIRLSEVRRLFASLASSRLVVFCETEPARFRTLVRLLSEYFGSALYLDGIGDSYTDAKSVLFRTDTQGGRLETNALDALKAAEASPETAVFAGLYGVRCKTLASYFAPYMSYIRYPLSGTPVRTDEGKGEAAYRRIPRNVWFLLNLAEGETPCGLDEDIASHAAFITVDFDTCPASELREQTVGLGYRQMEYLKGAASDFAPDEALWKKIDRLETSVSYRIGNKQWLGLEHFACVYAACGGEAEAALDEAAASRLIVPMTAHLRADGAKTDLGTVLQNVFGEDGGEVCKKLEKLLNERPRC